MREITLKVYTAAELSEKAREHAREQYARHLSEDGYITGYISDMFKQDLEEYGLDSLADKCYWSLSYCQGDGVAFYGPIDNDALAAKSPGFAGLLAEVAAVDPDCTISIMVEQNNPHYHHWNTMRVTVEHDSRADEIDDLAEALRELVRDRLIELSRQFEKSGYEEIEYMESMEQFLEAAEANGWEFYEDGELA